MIDIARWMLFETALESTAIYANPFWDVTCAVIFTAPSGTQQRVDAFWDGGTTWRVRFCPDEIGGWQWQTECTNPEDSGLHQRGGQFTCTAYTGDNPLYVHGPLRVAPDSRYLTWGDGTPFFWLGDTAWNGVLRARPADWDRYLALRREQGFTVIQYVSTQWRGHTRDAYGETAFTGTEGIQLNTAFFARLDARIAAINAHGLVAAPIMLWALTEIDPGVTLAEADAIRVIRYILARYGAYHVAWMLAGDGHYYDDHAPRWQRIGRAVFGDRHDRIVTLHPSGQSWVGEEFRAEPWFDFIGYQSGHGDSQEHLNWLVQGPPATYWANPPIRPVINLEPNYEGHPSYHTDHGFTDYEVRRAAYWSLLISPPAGVTYGNNSIWVWPEGVEPAENHRNLPQVQPWHQGLDLPGIRSMTQLKGFFEALPWWTLEPKPALLADQPGVADASQFIAAAQTRDGRQSVIYTPGPAITLAMQAQQGRWFDPRAGLWTPAHATDNRWNPPGAGDWVLLLDHSL